MRRINPPAGGSKDLSVPGPSFYGERKAEADPQRSRGSSNQCVSNLSLPANKDKEEIIVNTINYGTLKHWKWLVEYYGKEGVRQVLERRWETEFNPESRNLARLIFDVSQFAPNPRIDEEKNTMASKQN